MAKVVLALLKETQRSQAYAAAASGIARATLRNTIADGRRSAGHVPSVKLDTLADVAYGLNVPMSHVIELLSEKLANSACTRVSENDGTIEICFGDRLFRGKFVHLHEQQIERENRQAGSGT